MRNYKIFLLVLILSPFVFSFAFGLDIYIPIVPQMTQIFDTSPAMIQLTLSLFLLMTGAGQLFIGPLSDRWGRKAIFYGAAICYTVGSLICAFSTEIIELIIARLICSLGACGMLVNSFAIVRDLYSDEQSARVYSYLNGAIGISPTLAPIIGGYLAVALGWQSIFYFLACIGGLAYLITKYCIDETLPKNKRIKNHSHIFSRYKKIFCERQFIVHALMAGLAEGVFFCFFSISPFIIIELLNVPTHEFGYYFAVFGCVIGLGGFASGKIIERKSVSYTIRLGITLMFAGGLIMLIWYYLNGLSLSGFLIPMVIACTGAMFLVGSSASSALDSFAAMAGTASAAFGAVEFGVSAAIGSLLMAFPIHSTIPYGISIIFMAILSLSLYSIRKAPERFVASDYASTP
ncbi:MAG: Bcr/CflA family drug resistance efflux transporter [Chlamydiales bacterium 38-26]|nr:multidrug effflux MFS transporter [Chlamydiales bacterium]OJV11372.1 MAG: Bcr/CflA family drug resistance efflux transporter [Chlamydiales bacterium 38-26]